MVRGVRHRGLKRRWRWSDPLHYALVKSCIFHSRMDRTGVSLLLLLLHTESCAVVVVLFRSVFRVGDPVIPFFLLAGSIFLFPYNNRAYFIVYLFSSRLIQS